MPLAAAYVAAALAGMASGGASGAFLSTGAGCHAFSTGGWLGEGTTKSDEDEIGCDHSFQSGA
jgi:hypothetical protein